MGIDKNKLLRSKRMNFQFVEEGKWSKDVEIIKLKSQFREAQAKELKAKQAQLAKVEMSPLWQQKKLRIKEYKKINEISQQKGNLRLFFISDEGLFSNLLKTYGMKISTKTKSCKPKIKFVLLVAKILFEC